MAWLRTTTLLWVRRGGALELASLLRCSALTRVTLTSRWQPEYWTLLRIDVTGLGVSHVVPGGGVAAAGQRYRLLVSFPRIGERSSYVVIAVVSRTAFALLAAYGVANLLAFVPLTWRLGEYLLLVALARLAYVSLQVAPASATSPVPADSR
ncbi:MAG: hypothetical protein ABIQ59_08330 [Nocardioidaceae bacterium]